MLNINSIQSGKDESVKSSPAGELFSLVRYALRKS